MNLYSDKGVKNEQQRNEGVPRLAEINAILKSKEMCLF